jgi:hypothetical protein
MSTTTQMRTIPAAHLAFDLEAVLELARHLSLEEQDQLIARLLAARASAPTAAPDDLRARFATWDQESAAEPPSADEDAAYDALLVRLNGEAA